MHYTFNIERGNFTDAGQASSSVKRTLKQLGVDPANIKRTVVALFEAEIKSDKGGITMDTIKLTIDNREVEVPRGTTILKAAEQMGIKIPTLCHFELDGLALENRPGGCRVCVVEVVGRRNLAPACITECMPDMVVKTNSFRALNARRTVLELMLSDHPNDCLQCPKSGKCELQALAADMGIRDIPYKGQQSQYAKEYSPSIVRDANKCIMCRRCESVCHEYQSVGAIGAIERGFPAVVSTAFGKNLTDTNCVLCGQCVAVCPTGALAEVDNTGKIAAALKAIGFDWNPMDKIRNLADLRKMKEGMQSRMSMRENSDSSDAIIQIKVGMATSGIASGAKETMSYLITELDKRQIKALVMQVGDMGYSYAEPTVEVTIPGKDPVVFGDVKIPRAQEIIEKYIIGGELIEGILPANYRSI